MQPLPMLDDRDDCPLDSSRPRNFVQFIKIEEFPIDIKVQKIIYVIISVLIMLFTVVMIRRAS